ncbi:PAS domain-containing protein [Methanofollis fontis]|uniref:histidine kinase n=1 Tax=Methanofollis fontis TaxID=2052832 RepID=A0A483CVZ5_9EURY|nr:PAS domain S-box protein [Methanofollis fontis]TAJ45717.1 hypothetical protein CUJ86_03115 [Methanofollis fontis]
MKRHSDPADRDDLRDRIIGLGERSIHKSYYPELQKRMADLERFRALLDQSGDAFYLVDAATGVVADANRSAWEMTGYLRHAVIGAYFPYLIPPNGRGRIGALFSGRHRDGEAPAPLVAALQRVDGGRIPVEISLRYVRFGDCLYLVAVARDISDRLEAERELRIKEGAIESSTDGILITDLDGGIIYANRACLRMFGAGARESLRGVDFGKFFVNGGDALQIREGLSRESSIEGDFAGRRQDGSVFDIAVSGSFVRDEQGRPFCSMMICRDITERKAVEEMKSRAYEQLERNIEQFAVLGDHIRNPLQVIVGIASMIEHPMAEEILRHSYQIDEIIKKLDCGWVESENVRQYLRRREQIDL